jgi:DNA-directed RNA polymerase subunit RPC12/RpoP
MNVCLVEKERFMMTDESIINCDSCGEEFNIDDLNEDIMCFECHQEVLISRYESYNDLD